MAKMSKETYGKILETIGYEQHPANKNLYILTINETQYGVDLKGKEPDVFRIDVDGIGRVNDIGDSIIADTNSALSGNDVRAKPVDLKTEQEYCNAVPEVNEDETRTEPPQDEESVQEEEIPPSGSSVDDEPYHEEYLNEETPMETMNPKE